MWSKIKITFLRYKECKTIKGDKCIFPFEFNGKKYSECFELGGPESPYVCATEIKNGAANLSQLGVCGEFCKQG